MPTSENMAVKAWDEIICGELVSELEEGTIFYTACHIIIHTTFFGLIEILKFHFHSIFVWWIVVAVWIWY